MSLEAELLSEAGVLAVGKFAYRGDRFIYKGQLSEEQARWLSIVCRATTMSVGMQGRLLAALHPETRVDPLRGWMLQGGHLCLVVMTNLFCLLDPRVSDPNAIIKRLRVGLTGETMDWV